MTMTTRSGIYTSGDRTGDAALNTLIERKVIEVYNKQKLFGNPEMCTYRSLPMGNTYMQFSITDEPTLTTTSAALVEGQTPNGETQEYESVVIEATEYGQVKPLTSRAVKQAPIELKLDTARTVGEGLARVRDFAIQEGINDGTNVLYSNAGAPDTAGSRGALTTGDVLSSTLVANIASRLDANGAEKITIGGVSAYACVIHPNIAYALKTSSTLTSTTWASLATSGDAKAAEYARMGYLGNLFGVHMFESNNLLAFEGAGSGGIDVYPCYFWGKDAFAVVEDEKLDIMITDARPTDSDPLAQRTTIGGRFAIGADILKQNSMYRVEVVSNL